MTEKTMRLLVRLSILLIGVCGALVCLLWVPIDYGGFGHLDTAVLRSAEFIVQYAFHIAVSVPCFWLLSVAWRISRDMVGAELFTRENALRCKRGALVLAASLAVFTVGTSIFALLGWSEWILLYLLVAITGLAVATFLLVLSSYLVRAAEFKEECDLTV